MNDQTTNQQTLETYNKSIQQYINKTKNIVFGNLKRWLNSAIKGLPINAKILEMGCGSGRDADYLESKGYHVKRTDATPAFIKRQLALGREAAILNVITDDFGGPWGLILADAVFLHLTKDEFRSALSKARRALAPGGRLAISFKEGDYNEWEDIELAGPRFFQYWTRAELTKELTDAGFPKPRIVSSRGRTHSGREYTWLMVIANC